MNGYDCDASPFCSVWFWFPFLELTCSILCTAQTTNGKHDSYNTAGKWAKATTHPARMKSKKNEDQHKANGRSEKWMGFLGIGMLKNCRN